MKTEVLGVKSYCFHKRLGLHSAFVYATPIKQGLLYTPPLHTQNKKYWSPNRHGSYAIVPGPMPWDGLVYQ